MSMKRGVNCIKNQGKGVSSPQNLPTMPTIWRVRDWLSHLTLGRVLPDQPDSTHGHPSMPQRIVLVACGKGTCMDEHKVVITFMYRAIQDSQNSQYLKQNTHQGTEGKKDSHVYFLLQVFWVILLFCQIVLLSDINVVLVSQQYYLTSQQYNHGIYQQEVNMTTCL